MLRESEILALAAAEHGGAALAGRATVVSPASYAFATRVLRLRPASRLLTLAQNGALRLPVKPFVPAQVVVVSLLKPAPAGSLTAIRAALAALPVRDGVMDAIAEFAPSPVLAIDSDAETVAVLRELARVMRRGGRYLSGGALEPAVPSARASADKRRIDEWRREGRVVLHHTLRLVREDGTWWRLHERLRVRSRSESEALLNQAGFTVLNAFEGYDQQRHAYGPSGQCVLLCEKR